MNRGPISPPPIDTIDIDATLAEIEECEFVSLPALGERIGMTARARTYAITEGLIEHAPLTARKAGYRVTQDEALTILLAAVLAVAAGVAIVVMLRGVKQSGLTGEAAAVTLRSMTLQ